MISIVIPAHNEGENLKRLIPHILGIGKNHEFEILVCRSSGCADYPNGHLEDEKVKFLKCSGQGRALQMNQGAIEAQGNILAFLHADVWPPETFFMDIKDTIARGFEAGFFSYRFDKSSFLLKINASFTGRDSVFTGGGDQCLFIKKSVFREVGNFDETQVLMEDFEFFGRMKKRNIPYNIVQKDLIVSARKYEHNSYFRVNFSNLLLVILFKMGYPSTKLKSLHNRFIRMPD